MKVTDRPTPPEFCPHGVAWDKPCIHCPGEGFSVDERTAMRALIAELNETFQLLEGPDD
jgi:hypothetical protein